MLKIGISACFFHADPTRPIFKGKTLLYAEQQLVHWVQSGGALTYILPSSAAPAHYADYIASIDGLVLEGGSDVAPETYGEKAIRPEWKGDRVRDQMEIALLQEARKQRKPVLGVCRGLQVLNVAFAGGTLYQDIETQIPDALCHRNWEIYDHLDHTVKFTAGGWLEKIYRDEVDEGETTRKIVSVHHQAIKKLGEGLIVEAISPQDQLIEAIRVDSSDEWTVAVQWHPEFHWHQNHLNSKPLLRTFLEKVKEFSGKKG